MIHRLTVALVLLAAPIAARAQDCGMPGAAPPVRADLVVTPRQLAARLGPRGPVVLDVEMMGQAEYDGGHVPGAYLVNGHAFIADVGGLSWEMPPRAQSDSLVDALGVGDSDRVVLYGDPAHLGRVFLVLEAAGLAGRVGVLDGGIEAWRAAGLPVSTATPPARPRARRTARGTAPTAIVDAAWLRAHLNDPGVAIVDARSPEEYAGTAHESLPRTGHVPGARSLDWVRTFVGVRTVSYGDHEMEDFAHATLADVATLRRLLRDAGVAPGRTPVFYCTIGMRASHLYFIARYLGYDPKLYDGSMQDWSRRSDLPLTRGDRP